MLSSYLLASCFCSLPLGHLCGASKVLGSGPQAETGTKYEDPVNLVRVQLGVPGKGAASWPQEERHNNKATGSNLWASKSVTVVVYVLGE